MEIGKLIRSRRQELGLTLLDVAKAVGVSEGTVSKWESGHINSMKRNRIYALSQILQISPLAIIGIQSDAPATKDERIETIIKLLRQLPPDRQDYLISLIEFELSRVNSQASDPASR